MPEDKKILLVDSSPLFRASVKNYLGTKYNLEIDELTSAGELQQYLAAFGQDNLLLIILDPNLPDGSGVAALQNFMEPPGRQKLPFIAVSAKIDAKTVSEALKAGARDILAKPLSLEKLISRIDEVLSAEYHHKKRMPVQEYYEQIRVEVKRGQRGNYPLSLLLAGIYFSDTYRSVYKESSYRRILDLESKFPAKLKGIFRETDSIINLSPSEYFFILPFTQKEGVGTVQKKLEQVYYDFMPEEEREKLILVTASATYPGDGKSPEELIARLEDNFNKMFSAPPKNALP